MIERKSASKNILTKPPIENATDHENSMILNANSNLNGTNKIDIFPSSSLPNDSSDKQAYDNLNQLSTNYESSNFYTPTYSQWFHFDKIHRIERYPISGIPIKIKIENLCQNFSGVGLARHRTLI